MPCGPVATTPMMKRSKASGRNCGPVSYAVSASCWLLAGLAGLSLACPQIGYAAVGPSATSSSLAYGFGSIKQARLAAGECTRDSVPEAGLTWSSGRMRWEGHTTLAGLRVSQRPTACARSSDESARPDWLYALPRVDAVASDRQQNPDFLASMLSPTGERYRALAAPQATSAATPPLVHRAPFCRFDDALDRRRIPLRMRLGDLETVNRKEGKPGW